MTADVTSAARMSEPHGVKQPTEAEPGITDKATMNASAVGVLPARSEARLATSPAGTAVPVGTSQHRRDDTAPPEDSRKKRGSSDKPREF